MKNLNILNSFKSKKFKHGSFMTIFTCILLAFIILINLGIEKLNFTKDLTKNKLFSLSEQTKNIIKSNKNDVTIYAFYETGKENTTVSAVLNQYKSTSKNIKIEYTDPTKYPEKVQKYSNENVKVETGSLVVENGSKFKVLDQSSFVNYDYSDSASPTAESIAIEQSITSAILYVSSGKSTKVYALQGHGEDSVSEQISKQFELENYNISPLNLSVKDTKFEEGSILLVISPKRDLSPIETDEIKKYLTNGGRAIFLMDLIEADLPNFQNVFNYYGVAMQKAITVETNSQYISRNPLYLLPQQKDHEIMNSLINNDYRVLIPGCQSIKILDNKKDSLTIDTLLTTTKDSWGKVDLKTNTLDKEKNDIAGPLNIALAITDKAKDSNKKDTKLVIVSNASFIKSQISSLTSNANLDFFMNSVNWVQDKKDNLAIRPKPIDVTNIEISEFARLAYSGLVVIIVPAIIVIIGIIVWIKRRKK